MCWSTISKISDISGIISTLIALGLVLFARSLKQKIQTFRALETQVAELKSILARLSQAESRPLIPMNLKKDLKSILSHIQDYHKTNRDVSSLVDKYLSILETDADCTKVSMRLAVSEIINKIQISPELEYATK